MNYVPKFLFFIEREFHLALLLPLIKYIKINNKGQLALYSTEHYSSENSISNYGLRPQLLHEYLPFEIEIVKNPYDYHPDITFMADFSYHYTEGLGKIVNIGHGTISKGWYYTDRAVSLRENCADLICVPGTVHERMLSRKVQKPIKVTGMPKLDALFTGEQDREKILLKMGLSKENKTILLAPTFNEEFTILNYLSQDIRHYIPDYLNVIIKLHGVASEDMKDRFKKQASRYNNIYYTENYDITECFTAADVLITDMSSVIYEYVSTYKPVLLFDSPRQKEYINYMENDLEYQYRDVGIRFQDTEKIPELIFRALTGWKISDQVREIADSFVSIRDGSSSQRVIDEALKLLDQKAPDTSLFLLHQSNDLQKESMILKNRYKCRIYTDSPDLSQKYSIQYTDVENLYDILKNKDEFENEYLFIHNSEYMLSPCAVDLMKNYLVSNTKIGLIVPLIYNDEINYQQARLRLINQEKNHPDLTGVQITYSLTGQSLSIPFAEPVSYMLRFKDFADFTEQNSEKEYNWYDLLSWVNRKGMEIHLAFDVMVYPSSKDLKVKQPVSQEYKPVIKEEKVNEDHNTDLEFLKNHIVENPFDHEAIFNLVELLYQKRDWDSIDVYGNLIREDLRVFWYLIRSQEEQKNLEECRELFNELSIEQLQDTFWRTKLYILRAKINIKSQQNSEVESDLKKALALNHNDPDAWLTYGAFSLISQNLDYASYCYHKVIELDENNIIARLGLAMLAQFKNDHLSAISGFVNVLSQDEENLEALNGLVRSAWQSHRFDEAVKALNNYLEYHPADLNILFSLAGIYYEERNFKTCSELLDKILLLNPEFSDAQQLKDKLDNHI